MWSVVSGARRGLWSLLYPAKLSLRCWHVPPGSCGVGAGSALAPLEVRWPVAVSPGIPGASDMHLLLGPGT